MKVNSKSNISFYSNLSIILIIYMIAINNVKNNMLSLIAIAVSAIFILKPVYILPPLFISSLMGEYFVAFEGFGMARVMVTIFIIGSLINFIQTKTKIKLKHVILTLFVIVFNFISSATSITGNITPAITMTLNIVMLFCLAYTKEDDLNIFLKSMTGSCMILSMYILFLVASGRSYSVGNRLVIDESTNANVMGMALAQISAYFFGILMLSKNKTLKYLYLFIIGVNIINLFLTGSRSATLGCIVSSIIIIFIKMFRKDNISKKIYALMFVAFLIVGVYVGVSKLGGDIIQRFTLSSVLESGGTGRTLIWNALISYVIPNNLWFGVGLGGENVYISIAPYVPIAHGTHNILLTIIAQVGIVGSIMYITFFVKSTKTIIKNYIKFEYLIIPLAMILTAFINGMGEDIFDERYLWFTIGLGLMFMHSRTLINKEEKI